MKKLLKSGYTFDASAQTIVHADFSDIGLEGIQLITNVTDQVIIYNFADTSKGGTLSTDTLTLEYDTTTMDDADKIQIIVDDGVTTMAVTQSGTWDEVGINDSGNSITVDNGGTFAVQDATAQASLATIAGDTTDIEAAVELIDDVIKTDDAAFTPATDKVAMIGAMVDDTGTDSVDEGDAGAVRMSANRILYTQGHVAAGATDAGNPLKVGGKYNSTKPTLTDGQRGDVELTTRGAVSTALYVADSATAVATVVSNADNVAESSIASKLQVAALGYYYDGSAFDRVRGDSTDGMLVNLGSNNDVVATGGGVADDGTTPGNPVMVGGFAISPDGTDPGSVSAEADVARFRTDLNRRLLVNTDHPRSLHKHLDGSSAYTDESIAADPGDGFQIVITNIIASTGAATALNFFLEEGSTKIFGPIYLEAVAGRGFASGPIHLPVTASTAVTLTSSAAIAQSFDIDYFIQAV